MVIHTLLSDYTTHKRISGTIALVEKSGSSIESLKQVVADFLNKAGLRN